MWDSGANPNYKQQDTLTLFRPQYWIFITVTHLRQYVCHKLKKQAEDETAATVDNIERTEKDRYMGK